MNARTTSSINRSRFDNMCNEATLEFQPVSSSVHEVIREQSVESRALNGRLWAFVSSVGANSTPDIGESIFSGHFRRCQCWCWQHQRWFYGHTEVFLHSFSKSFRAQSIFAVDIVFHRIHTSFTCEIWTRESAERLGNMGTEGFPSSGYTGHGLGQ